MLNRTEDERGSFYELWKEDWKLCPSIPWRQISYLTINPGQTRGNHYHSKLIEMFIVVKGTAIFDMFIIPEKTKHTFSVSAGEKEVAVLPYTNHSIYSEKGCEILILSTKVFDSNDQDTFKLEDER